MYEALLRALSNLSTSRKQHPGLEQIGAVMHDLDAVVGAYDAIVASEATELQAVAAQREQQQVQATPLSAAPEPIAEPASEPHPIE